MQKKVAKRIVAWILSVCMIAGMVDLSGFTVRAADSAHTISRVEVSESYLHDAIYNGSPYRPGKNDIEVYTENDTQINADAYEIIDYGENINAGGGAYVEVKSVGDYGDTTRGYFTIKQKNIADRSVEAKAHDVTLVQPGTNIQTTVEVKDGNITLTGSTNPNSSDADYTYTITGNSIATEKEVTATVTITGRKNYTGTKEVTFKIIRYDSANLKIVFQGGAAPIVTYNGDAKTLRPGATEKDLTEDTVDFLVQYEDGGKMEILNPDDYRVDYNNNRNATLNAGISITVTSGKYKDLTIPFGEYTFTIKKKFNDKYPANSAIVARIEDQHYQGYGKAITLKPEDIWITDMDMGEGSRIDPSYYEIDQKSYVNNDKISTPTQQAFVRVHALTASPYSNYSQLIPFNIIAADLEHTDISIDDSACIYDGEDQFGNLKVTVGNGEYVQSTNGTDGDYIVERVSGGYVAAGTTHRVRIRATSGGQFQEGYVEKTFTIHQRNLKDSGIRAVLKTDGSNGYPSNGYTYTGYAHTPKLVITYNNGKTETTLAEFTHYTLSYASNINATGSPTVTATGTGNFTGTRTVDFVINKMTLTSSNTIISGLSAEEKYTGSAITPLFNLNLTDNRTLGRDHDYRVEYAENENVGTAKILITGTGNYDGEIETSFKIVQRSITDGTRIVIPNSMDYTGSQLRPEVAVYLGNVQINETNYTVEYGENKDVGQGTVKLTGVRNFTGETTVSFTINKRNIANPNYLKVTSIDGPGNGNYDFMDTQALDQRFYRYTGKAIEPALTISFGGGDSGMFETSLTKGTDYSLAFEANTEIGTATIVITGEGNYSGAQRVQFKIKGCLDDYIQNDGFTKIEIPTQIYTRKRVEPKNAIITFADHTSPLVLNTDFRIDRCENNIEITNENSKALAWIEGIGDYYGSINAAEFDIRPLRLNEDDLEENHYVISNINDSYIYSGLVSGIKPVPNITHGNGEETDTLVAGASGDYTVDYFSKEDGAADTPVTPVNVGKYAARITGDGRHYTGFTEREYEIAPYDISASYAKIEIQGVEEEVLLDAVKDKEAYGYTGTAKMDGDAVIQSALKVMYTPVDMENVPGAARELTVDEFDVSYENNTTIGKATITITGKGNFEGTVTKDFQIRGDLAGENTTVTVDDCVYTPGKNTPEPTVTYQINHVEGAPEVLTLEKGKDYTVDYENNENATLNGAHATVKILSQGATGGDYVNSAEASFQIAQRDLSKAIGEDKDELLSVTGLEEDGYEYTGSRIVPALAISCDGTSLVAGTGEGTYDYEISAVNNLNVYTYAENSVGEQERVFPIATVSARKDAEGNYVGNYCGQFTQRFQINPREIGESTLQVAGIEDVYDYTGDPIRPEVAAGAVTWSREGVAAVTLEEGTDYTVSYGEETDNVKIGDGKVTITAVPESNYTGAKEITFRIMANLEVGINATPAYILLSPKNGDKFEAPYGAGERVYPDMVFQDWSGVYCGLESEPKDLQVGVDFEFVNERNNINVGDEDAAYVEIRGTGDYYRGQIELHYTVTPMDLSADEENHVTAEFRDTFNQSEKDYLYTGNEIQPQMIIRNREVTMQPSKDYQIVRYEHNIDISTEETQAAVLIRGGNTEGTNSNYVGEKWFYFNIIPRSIESMTLTVSSEPQIFSREEKRPEVQVSYRENNQTIALTEGTDYDVLYTNNLLAATADSGENAPTITVTAKGTYKDELTTTFTIEPESFGDADAANEDIIIKGADVFYTGEPVTTTFTVQAADGTELIEGEDYEVGEFSDNTQPGTGYAEIKGINNYTGSQKVSFLIVPPEGDFVIEDIPEVTYNTQAFEPEVAVSFVGGAEQEITIPVTEGKDFQVEYVNNTNVGTATVRIIGINSFADIDVATKDFTILPKNIGTPDEPSADMRLQAADQEYTGRGVQPEIQLTFQAASDNSVTLVEGTDYTVNCSGNVDVGIATATIIGMGNYAGVLQTQFRIVGNLDNALVAEIPVQDYTGLEICPEPEVSFAGEVLSPGVDYTVDYRDNIEEGIAAIILTGTGEAIRAEGKSYVGTKEIQFEITKDREFTEDTVVVGVAESYPYTGTAIEPPVVRVEYNGEVLTAGQDYSVSYANNINATTAPNYASVIITGMGRYHGQKVQAFQIRAQQMGRAKVAAIADQIYNGQEIHPAVQVQNAEGTKSLEQGTDYNVVYVNSKTPGKASVIIRGMGNYTGAQTVNFNIQVPKLTGVKVSGYGTNSLKFSWTRNRVVSGYEVYNSENRPVAKVEKGTATSVKANKLKAATTATYRVRAFVIDDGQYYYGPFTRVKGTTAPNKAAIKSVTSKKSKQAVIKWGKVSKATGYQVYRSTSKNGTYKRIATTSKTSYTDKKATGGKRYYYKIRVYRKVSNKNYFSDYSTAKSVKAKK